MRLTKKKAIDICIELWEWLAETGKGKEEWEGWEKYGQMWSECPFCQYSVWQEHRGCKLCPYFKKFGYCAGAGQPYVKWADAKQVRTRKKYAELFLAQLREIKAGIKETR